MTRNSDLLAMWKYPRERYERISYAYADRVRLEEYLGEARDGAIQADRGVGIAELAELIRKTIEQEPLYFAELAERFSAFGFAAVSRALGALHARGLLWQDSLGRHCLAGSSFAAEAPAQPS